MKKWKSPGREIREVWTKVPLKDRQGRVAALLGVGSTPVEEHQAKRMITHWLSLVQCFAHPIIELTPDGTIGSWNPAAEQMYGYTQQEALGRSAAMLAVQEERELLLDAVSRAGKGESVLDCECRHRTKDGAEVYVSLTLSPILGLWGRQTGISVVARDISSRKQVEESLRYSAEEPRLLLSAWETEIFIKDRDLRIQFANEAYARKRGMTPEQLLGLSDYDLFDAELAAKFQQEDRRAMEAGEPVTERSVAVGPLGTGQYEKEQIKVPLKDGSGNVTGVLGIVQWPEQQRLAEEVVAHWASLVRSSDDAVIGVALDGTILSWNQGAEQVYGYTEDDAVGHSIELLTLEDASERMEQALQQVAAGRSVRNYESEHRTKDGSSVHVAVTFSPVPDAEGEVSAVSIIARDITARKQAEQALQESEERFRLLAETAFDGISICEWDPAVGQRRLVYCNDRFVQMSGYSRQQLEQADDLNALIEPEDTEEEGRRIRDRLRRGLPARGRASWNRPDGRENVYEWSAIRVEVGGKHRLFGVDRDITEHERAERQLEQYADQLAELNAELERSNRELQDFTHTVSHDLQEPLRKIHTFGQFLVEDCGDQLPDGGLEHLRRMQDAAVRMKRLISHLLDLARVGSRGGEMVPVDSARVVAETVEMLSQAIEECDATVSIRGELPPVVADEVQLAQVLQNLISNALKFHSPQRQPRVEISAERDGQMVGFSVADNGIGMEERFLDKIFGVFQRLYPRDQYEGAGVGLALCRKIVTRHGGRIWADSVRGEGTTVHFKLPAVHGRVDDDGPR